MSYVNKFYLKNFNFIFYIYKKQKDIFIIRLLSKYLEHFSCNLECSQSFRGEGRFCSVYFIMCTVIATSRAYLDKLA